MTFRGFVVAGLSAVALMAVTLDASAGKYGGSSRSSSSSSRSFSFGNSSSYLKRFTSSSSSKSSSSKSSSKSSGWGGSTKQSSSKPSVQKTSTKPQQTQSSTTQSKSGGWGGSNQKSASGSTRTASSSSKQTRFASAPSKGLSKKKQDAAYKAYQKKHQSKFKSKKNPVKLSDKKRSDNPLYQRASRESRFDDYWDRRDRFYNDWRVPGYTYRGSSSYGLFDGMFLGYMLSHISTPSYGAFAYHHWNDPGMQSWRREMESQARENRELRRQLNTLESQVAGMKGTPVDPDYIPEGVDADMVMAPEMVNSLVPTFRLCTAGKDGNYQRFGELVRNAARSGVDVRLVNTAGSMENLKRMQNNSCDGAYVQRNAFPAYAQRNPSGHFNFERVASPAIEYAHLVCNRDSGVDDVGDLPGKSLLIGAKGSGSELTWSDFTQMDAAYRKVNTRSLGGVQALNKVAIGQSDCMLYVASLNTELMQRANGMGDRLIMVPVNDWDFNDKEYNSGKLFAGHRDQSGEEVYVFQKIPGGQYNEIQDGILSSVETLTVPVDMVASLSWAEKHPNAYNAFIGAVMDSQDAIEQTTHEN